MLLPISFIYCLIVIFKRVTAKKIDFKIPIISIGNLTVGGSGKTPLLISIAKDYQNIAVILRGYKRESKGLYVVKENSTVKVCGDEAKVYKNFLPNALVIVSEDRVEAILKAKNFGVSCIFLDDGFSKAHIKKFDILIKAKNEPKLPFCLPSGAYREPIWLYGKADLVIKEDEDFKRVVEVKNPTQKMVLITAISKPKRLDKFLPKVEAKIYFEDHHMFAKEEIEAIVKKYNATSILTTSKDAVKMEKFGFALSILDLKIELDKTIKEKINQYLATFC